MKKLLFLLFGVIFALAGCADESGTNGGNTETCPITSADFTYERTINENSVDYKVILLNQDKIQYENRIKWVTNEDKSYNTIEPIINFSMESWETTGQSVTLYYNNIQCGPTITLQYGSDIGSGNNETYIIPEICTDILNRTEKFKFTPLSDKLTTKYRIEYKDPNYTYNDIDNITWLIGDKEYYDLPVEVEFDKFENENKNENVLSYRVKDINGLGDCEDIMSKEGFATLMFYPKVVSSQLAYSIDYPNLIVESDGVKCEYDIDIYYDNHNTLDFPVDIKVSLSTGDNITIDNTTLFRHNFKVDSLYNGDDNYCNNNWAKLELCYECPKVNIIVYNHDKNFYLDLK